MWCGKLRSADAARTPQRWLCESLLGTRLACDPAGKHLDSAALWALGAYVCSNAIDQSTNVDDIRVGLEDSQQAAVPDSRSASGSHRVNRPPQQPAPTTGSSRVPVLVFGLAVLVFAAAQVKLSTSKKLRLSGDEPHVLMTTLSMIKDRDLDVSNNYARGDYREIGRRAMVPQVPAVDGYIPPEKGIGFPALLVPFHALGGVFGSRLAVLVIATLVLPLLFWICVVGGLSRTSASFACLGLSVCLPWDVHAHLILPESLAGFLLLMIAGAFVRFEQTGKRGYALVIGLFTIALPIVYLKYSALAVASGVLLACSPKLRRDWLVYAGAPLALLYAALWVSTYGWSISIGTGAGPHDFHSRDTLANIGNAFLDRNHGLLTRAPIVLVALLGLVRGPASGNKLRWYFGAAVAAYALLYGLTTLRPGESAPGRYLVASMPAYSVLGAFGLLYDGPRYRVRLATYILFVALTAIFLATAFVRNNFGLPEWYLSPFPNRYYP